MLDTAGRPGYTRDSVARVRKGPIPAGGYGVPCAGGNYQDHRGPGQTLFHDGRGGADLWHLKVHDHAPLRSRSVAGPKEYRHLGEAYLPGKPDRVYGGGGHPRRAAVDEEIEVAVVLKSGKPCAEGVARLDNVSESGAWLRRVQLGNKSLPTEPFHWHLSKMHAGRRPPAAVRRGPLPGAPRLRRRPQSRGSLRQPRG